MEQFDASQEVQQICVVMKTVLSAMLDRPETLKVVPHHSETGVVLSVQCDPSDISKLIGKQGRTARALRTVLMAVSKHNCFHLDIAESYSGIQTNRAPIEADVVIPCRVLHGA